MDVNWEAVRVATFTAIRAEWPVKKLQVMAIEGNATPASGDALIQRKADIQQMRRGNDAQ